MRIFEDENLDDLGINNLFLIQKKTGFKFGIDAVLLSDIVRCKRGEKILDLCTGSGIVPVLLSAKTEASELIGVELLDEYVDMANRSVLYNNLQDRVKIIQADVSKIRQSKVFAREEFNVICANPPYFKRGGAILNDVDNHAIARHEIHLNLRELFDSVDYLLKNNGAFYMIHRPDRLVDIVYEARLKKLEPKVIRFVQPKLREKANLMLIKFVKNAGSELRFENPLIVYNEDGSYTDEIDKIYGR